MTEHTLERYANDVLAALVIGSFVAFVSASALGDVALGFSGLRRSVVVNGVVLVVLIPTVWVFGAQTLVAVSNLAKAAFVPEQVATSPPAATPAPSDADSTSPDQPPTAANGGRRETPQADTVRDSLAGHPHEADRARRRRMIQSEWPPLDVFLSYVVLAPLVVVLLAPFAGLVTDTVGPVVVPIADVAVPRGWFVSVFVVALIAVAVGWRRANRSGVAWLVLGAFLFGTAVASRIGLDSTADGSAASFQLSIGGLGAVPDQFLVLYFVLVLVVVIWAFGERAATAVALVRRRSTDDQ